MPPAQLAAARLLLSGLLFLALAVATGHARGVLPSLRRAPAWWAAVGQAGFNLCFLGAVRGAGVAVGTLVAIGATPVLTGLVTRRVSRGWLAATGIAVAGLVLLVAAQLGSSRIGSSQPGGGVGEVAVSPLGVLLALGASASYATYIVAGEAAASRGLEIPPYLAAAFALSAVLTCPLLLSGPVAWTATTGGALLVGYLALVPTLVSYSLFNRGLRGVAASTASTLGLVEPVVAAVLAYVVLGERLTPLGVAGAVTILAGLVLIVRTATAQEQSSPG